MEFDISFHQACKFIKDNNPELIGDVDKLISVILIFSTPFLKSSAVITTGTLSLLADLLGIKGELSKISKSIFNKITHKQDNDPFTKFNRMQAAYYLISYTAFFEALEKLFPEFS